MSKWAIQQFLSTVSILTDTVNVTVINYTQWSGQTNLTTALVPDLSFPPNSKTEPMPIFVHSEPQNAPVGKQRSPMGMIKLLHLTDYV